jgi:hypothetical protein
LHLFLSLLTDRVKAASAVILQLLVQVSVFKLILHALFYQLFQLVSAGCVGKHDFLFVGVDVGLICVATLDVNLTLLFNHLLDTLLVKHPIN